VLLAAIHQERGEVPAALEALRRALCLAPESVPAHFLLGTMLLRGGEKRRGRRYLETVVDLLRPVPRDQAVPGANGLTPGRLLETAQAYLAFSHPEPAGRFASIRGRDAGTRGRGGMGTAFGGSAVQRTAELKTEGGEGEWVGNGS
jgi:hypothetical protein